MNYLLIKSVLIRVICGEPYSYTRYDAKGRVTEVGELLSTEPIDSLKAKINTLNFPDLGEYTAYDITKTVYDKPHTHSDSTFLQENLRSRVSWTAMIEKDQPDTVFTLYSYDEHGNVKGLLQQIPGLAPKRTEYVYDLVSGNVNFVMYQFGYDDQFIHRYSYDADNRIEYVHTSTDGYLWNREATYHYYPHGPLARVELGEYNVQGLDYYYTLQGWLKGVNMPGEGDLGADGVNGLRTGKDAFAFTLGYHADDFKPINPNVVTSDGRDGLWNRYDEQRGTSGLYNGNIAWMNTDLPGLEQDPMQAMVYHYDQLHRIVEARSLKEYSSNGYATRTSTPKAYDVDYSYDGNGNLLTLNRRNEQGSVQDAFEYSYYENTNKLRNVDGGSGNNYTYDEVGNLISDSSEGITGIEWTPYGKVRSVNKSDGTKLEFRYDAAGQRIEKKVGESMQRYVRDASGNPMAIYEMDSLTEQSIYGSSRLGIQVASSQQGYRSLGEKRYELSNHLGNVLAVVTDNIHLNQDSTWAKVINITDYYPFGLAMEGRGYQDTTVYRYGFNGMERDNEWKGEGRSYDFGARIYDPKVGRWLSVDPHASSYPSLSGYSGFANNPLIYIDPDGRDIILVHGTWTSSATWENPRGIRKASNNLFNDDKFGKAFDWSGDNFSGARTNAAIGLIDHVRTQMKSDDFNGSITLVGHSHGGNVSIEALNMMTEMKEFDNIEFNLLTINTPVRDDYQLSEKASERVTHANVYDKKDPVQINGGNSTWNKLFGFYQRGTRIGNRIGQQKGSGELGPAGRVYNNAQQNISVDNAQGVTGDFHNSHNRTNDWINKTEDK
ncbi:hypothetical protein KIH41_17770 [Litoribacter ruber]|uniref:RHS repeat domain-containing protein n=1 Tax=Litoribacter ruber TaxID=702568 RepID=UPI001BDA9083|nr:RHS repeat-associated core domain-containing protein [Litoribacter ruber]MBT0813141.1 hypothetical protein [Litoribacter ruber]